MTVERKSGFFSYKNIKYEGVVDLPGIYSLNIASESIAIDESIACQFLSSRQTDVVINILDGSNLERHLYLTTQLMEMGIPMVIAVNMMDIAKKRGMKLQLECLEKILGCPVVGLSANTGKGLVKLKDAVAQVLESQSLTPVQIPYPEPVMRAIRELADLCRTYNPDVAQGAPSRLHNINVAWMERSDIREIYNQDKTNLAIRLLEDDTHAKKLVPPETLAHATKLQQNIRDSLGEDADSLLADARYRFIHQTVEQCVQTSPQKISTWTVWLDIHSWY